MRYRGGFTGFTLIELMMVLGLGSFLLGLALYSLRPGASKTSTIALSAALADEFRSARQLAIARGCPIAVGFSTKGSRVADAVFRLEGWNTPLVTSSSGYSGDYPRLGFAAASWAGASVESSPSQPPLSKFVGFDLDTWIPDKHKDNSLLCFTPDGGVLSHGFPSVGGRFVAVVAIDPVFDSQKIVGGAEPCVLYVSPAGAVEYSKGLPGATLTGGEIKPRSEAILRETFSETEPAKITISEIMVRPVAPPSDTDSDAFCTPGEQVTFEVYAYDPQGRQLFAQWTQKGTGGKKGNFGFPKSREGKLTKEAERMEYVESPPKDVKWDGGAGKPPGGCFRARWSWTVPQDSKPGEAYDVTVDVQDATGTAKILNPPTFSFKTPLSGRFLAEIRGPGGSQLVKMNRTGQGRIVLTQPGVEESLPSVDRSGTKVAFLQGRPGQTNQKYVKVRSLVGGGEVTIAGPGRYTSVSISPNGGWVSYRRDHAGTPGKGDLFIRRLGPSDPVHHEPQNWRAQGTVQPDDIEPDRVGWSPDNKYVIWADGGDGDIEGAFAYDGMDLGGGVIKIGTLTSSGGVTNVRTIFTSTNNRQQVYAPTIFDPGDGPRVLFSCGTNNPFVAHFPFKPSETTYGNPFNTTPCETVCPKIDLNGSDKGSGSGDFDDVLPNVSANGRKLVLPRLDRPNDYHALIANWKDTPQNFVAEPSEKNTISRQDKSDKIISIVWLP